MVSRSEQVDEAYVDLLQTLSVAQHLFVEGCEYVLPHTTIVPRQFRRGSGMLVVGQMAALTRPDRSALKPGIEELLNAPRADRTAAKRLLPQLREYWTRVYEDERAYWTSDGADKEFQRWWQAHIRLAAGVAGHRLPARFGRREAAEFADDAFDRVAWANIVKVDLGNANYIDEEDRRWHRRNGGLQILREEIRMLRPAAVVFAVGPAFRQFIQSALPGATFKDAPKNLSGERVEVPEFPQVQAFACWHFERLKHSEVDDLAAWLLKNIGR